MKIVVDTNIAFSAILNANSKIARIILQPRTRLNFYSTEQLLKEITEHKQKLQQLTDYTDYELDRMILLITNRIRFINVRLIPKTIYEKSNILVSDIDEDDTEFVALTEHLKGKLWSGDKELQNGLIKKKWNKFISTIELFQLISKSRIGKK
jgi:predicted nucleic acid-binding protein